MSIGNLTDSGNKGTNFPWQWKMLIGQQSTIDALNLIITNTSNLQSYTRIPNIVRSTGSGSIGVICYSFSILNTGSANGTILGSVIKPGENLNFDAGLTNKYAASSITFDGTGTELLITYNT